MTLKVPIVVFALLLLNINSIYAYSIEEFTYERFAPSLSGDNEKDQVTSEELKAVADIFNGIENIQEKAEEKTVEILHSKGLDMEAYDRFISWQQDSIEQLDMTSPKKEALLKARDQIREMRDKYDLELKEVIENNGLTQSRYREIQAELQNNPGLREELLEYWSNSPSSQNNHKTAQYEVSSAEFKTFANILDEINAKMKQFENDKKAIIEDSMLEPEQYEKLIMEEQAESSELEVTELKKQEYENIRKEIQALQADFRDDTIELMTEKGMDFKRFREIQEAIQKSPELQQELIQHLD